VVLLLQDAVGIAVLVLSSLGASLGNGTAAGCSGDRRASALLVRDTAALVSDGTVLQDTVVIVVLAMVAAAGCSGDQCTGAPRVTAATR
jgi:hypothetical protein